MARAAWVCVAVAAAAALGAVAVEAQDADGGGGFYIKSAAKSVPRLGRRGDFYTKGGAGAPAASKTVPRIGKKSLEEAPLGVEEPKPVYLVRYARGMKGGSWDTSDISWDEIDRAMEERPDLWQKLMESGGPAPTNDADRREFWRRYYEQ